jgi:hypothetical protein
MPVLSIKNYREALTKNAQISLAGFEKGALSAVKNDKNEPLSWFGSSSVVFKLTDGKNNYALKCFVTELNGRWPFLEIVKEKLDEIKNDGIVSFEIFKDALAVEDEKKTLHNSSIILMPWIEGERLQDRVSFYCKNSNAEGLRKLSSSFFDLAVNQLGRPYSHGDINPANIIVKPDCKMILIDHDTFGFADTINGMGVASWSLGYQHPYRHPNYVDLDVDDFPFLLIALSLKALELDPGLFHRFNTSKGLLFTVDDFKRPWDSKLIAELEKTEDPFLKCLLNVLQLSLVNPNIHIPDLLKYLSGDISIEEQNELNEAVQKQNESTNKQSTNVTFENPASNSPLSAEEDIPVFLSAEVPENALIHKTPAIHQKRRNLTKIGVCAALFIIIVTVLGIKYYFPGNALVMPGSYEGFAKPQSTEKTDLSDSKERDFTKVLNKAHRSLINDSNSVYANNSIIADTRSSVEKLKNSLLIETEEKTKAAISGSEKKPDRILKTRPTKIFKKVNADKPKRDYDVEFRKLVY